MCGPQFQCICRVSFPSTNPASEVADTCQKKSCSNVPPFFLLAVGGLAVLAMLVYHAVIRAKRTAHASAATTVVMPVPSSTVHTASHCATPVTVHSVVVVDATPILLPVGSEDQSVALPAYSVPAVDVYSLRGVDEVESAKL